MEKGFRKTGNTEVPKDALMKVLKTQLIINSWKKENYLLELVMKNTFFLKNWTEIAMD